jgi:hypothetical protein
MMLPKIRFVSDLTKYAHGEKHIWVSDSNDQVATLKSKGWNRVETVSAVCITWDGQDYWLRLLDDSTKIRA